MANHKSALKRVRQDAIKRLRNRYYKKTTRNAIRDLRAVETKSEAEKMMPQVQSLIDGLVKRNQFHKNKAANLKSKLMKFVDDLD